MYEFTRIKFNLILLNIILTLSVSIIEKDINFSSSGINVANTSSTINQNEQNMSTTLGDIETTRIFNKNLIYTKHLGKRYKFMSEERFYRYIKVWSRVLDFVFDVLSFFLPCTGFVKTYYDEKKMLERFLIGDMTVEEFERDMIEFK